MTTRDPHKYPAGEGQEKHNLLNHHLNRHVEHVACQTCHSPVYAKCTATKIWWDWSKAGDKARKAKKDRDGLPDYSWVKGKFVWKESVKPAHLSCMAGASSSCRSVRARPHRQSEPCTPACCAAGKGVPRLSGCGGSAIPGHMRSHDAGGIRGP